jgi:hypothetical protein
LPGLPLVLLRSWHAAVTCDICPLDQTFGVDAA